MFDFIKRTLGFLPKISETTENGLEGLSNVFDGLNEKSKTFALSNKIERVKEEHKLNGALLAINRDKEKNKNKYADIYALKQEMEYLEEKSELESKLERLKNKTDDISVNAVNRADINDEVSSNTNGNEIDGLSNDELEALLK